MLRALARLAPSSPDALPPLSCTTLASHPALSCCPHATSLAIAPGIARALRRTRAAFPRLPPFVQPTPSEAHAPRITVAAQAWKLLQSTRGVVTGGVGWWCRGPRGRGTGPAAVGSRAAAVFCVLYVRLFAAAARSHFIRGVRGRCVVCIHARASHVRAPPSECAWAWALGLRRGIAVAYTARCNVTSARITDQGLSSLHHASRLPSKQRHSNLPHQDWIADGTRVTQNPGARTPCSRAPRLCAGPGSEARAWRAARARGAAVAAAPSARGRPRLAPAARTHGRRGVGAVHVAASTWWSRRSWSTGS